MTRLLYRLQANLHIAWAAALVILLALLIAEVRRGNALLGACLAV